MNNTNESPAHGTEAEVCADIARRQRAGMSKYGQSVANNPSSLREWHQHAYEEALDLAVYLKRILTFDAPEPVAEAPVTEQPAKAREWTMAILESGSKYVFDLGRLDENELRQHCHATEVITIREILPNEASLLEEAVGLLVAGILRPGVLHNAAVDTWLSLHFPAPAPEPAWIPEVGEMCQVSGANMDLETGRAFVDAKVLAYDANRTFGIFQKGDCWPFVEKMSNCTFQRPTPTPQSHE